MADVMDDPRIVEISNGFRLQETDKYVVEVWGYIFNWRLVVYPAGQLTSVSHGYCYFGRGLEPLARAVAAGLEWQDPMHTDPTGFDKKAF